MGFVININGSPAQPAGNLINCKVLAEKACETNSIGAGGR